MAFVRAHHRAIHKALLSFDCDLLERAECFFGGGTAIVLVAGEYRESVDIDFLCASTDGYRQLIEAVWVKGIAGLLRPETQASGEITELRELRRGRDKILTVIGVESEGETVPVKFEVVREARIDLVGAVDPHLGVPVLARPHMYAEKLMANADRGNDSSTLSRDIIDLSMMMLELGPVPDEAWALLDRAYGRAGRMAWDASVTRIRDRAWLETCMDKMQMDPALTDRILALHGGALPPAPNPLD